MYKYIATFAGGAILGAIGTLLWLRKEYNKKIEEAVLENEKKNTIKEEKKTKEIEEQAEEKAYQRVNKELLKRHGYTSDAAESVVRDDLPNDTGKETPYGISGEDFLMRKQGEYYKISLLYFDDGVLSTESGEVINDILYVLGPNWMKEIGKYDDDVAYIRNDRAGSDYEVVLEHRNYSDYFGVVEED